MQGAPAIWLRKIQIPATACKPSLSNWRPHASYGVLRRVLAGWATCLSLKKLNHIVLILIRIASVYYEGDISLSKTYVIQQKLQPLITY